MNDKRNSGLRHVPDGVRESRNSKLSQKKMKTKRRVTELKDLQSLSYYNSYNCRRDFTTPKRPRIRFNGCYSGDLPNETETLQDIIWDSNSPTQNFTGKEVDGKVIDISEIVNRIAPKRSNEGDSVLQWIGDGAIPCTPEVRQPRVRRIPTWQNNVEDLMKLAKQFDINMTRQDKEKQQNTTESLNKLKSPSDGTTGAKLSSVPVTLKEVTGCLSQAQQDEAKLQALFDGPTKHVSGRLIPRSENCTPESSTHPAVHVRPGSGSAVIRKSPGDATEVDFDDDWENDDLLNDSFVLEMTQNPLPLNVAHKQSIESLSSENCNFVTKINLSVSNGKDICLQIQQGTTKGNKTLPVGQTSVRSTFRLKPFASAQDQTTEKLLKTSPVELGKYPAHSSQGNQQEMLLSGAADKAAEDIRGSGQPSSFDKVAKEDLKCLLDSDGLWNDDEEDDKLLCQACDDVERVSASQEQQKQSMDLISADNTPFARSNSVPCSSGTIGFKQDCIVLPTSEGTSAALGSVMPYHCTQANKLIQMKSGLGPNPASLRPTDTLQTSMAQSTRVGNASHHFTFKRHLSDSNQQSVCFLEYDS